MAPHSDSWNMWLSTFKVGERRYTETSLDRHAHDTRTMCAPPSRRPESIAGWQFTAALFTGVSARSPGDIRYLICVERTA